MTHEASRQSIGMTLTNMGVQIGILIEQRDAARLEDAEAYDLALNDIEHEVGTLSTNFRPTISNPAVSRPEVYAAIERLR